MSQADLNEHDLDLLSAYLDGELSPEETVALESRLETDARLQAELDALRNTVTLIQSLPPLTAPRDFRLTPAMIADISDSQTASDDESGGIAIAPPVRSGSTRRRIIPFATLAAVAATFILAVGFFAVLSNSSAPAGEPAGASYDVAQAPTREAPTEAAFRTAATAQQEVLDSKLESDSPATPSVNPTDSGGDAAASEGALTNIVTGDFQESEPEDSDDSTTTARGGFTQTAEDPPLAQTTGMEADSGPSDTADDETTLALESVESEEIGAGEAPPEPPLESMEETLESDDDTAPDAMMPAPPATVVNPPVALAPPDSDDILSDTDSEADESGDDTADTMMPGAAPMPTDTPSLSLPEAIIRIVTVLLQLAGGIA